MAEEWALSDAPRARSPRPCERQSVVVLAREPPVQRRPSERQVCRPESPVSQRCGPSGSRFESGPGPNAFSGSRRAARPRRRRRSSLLGADSPSNRLDRSYVAHPSSVAVYATLSADAYSTNHAHNLSLELLAAETH